MVGWLGGRVGGVEEWRIKLSQLSTRLKLKLKLSLAIFKFAFTPLKYSCYLSPWIPLFFPAHSRGEELFRKKTVQEYICQMVMRAKDLSSKDGGYSQFLF